MTTLRIGASAEEESPILLVSLGSRARPWVRFPTGPAGPVGNRTHGGAREPNETRSMGDSSSADAPILSVVIPLLNEEAVLDKTYTCLKRELDRLGLSYEMVFVDDGS